MKGQFTAEMLYYFVWALARLGGPNELVTECVNYKIKTHTDILTPLVPCNTV